MDDVLLADGPTEFRKLFPAYKERKFVWRCFLNLSNVGGK